MDVSGAQILNKQNNFLLRVNEKQGDIPSSSSSFASMLKNQGNPAPVQSLEMVKEEVGDLELKSIFAEFSGQIPNGEIQIEEVLELLDQLVAEGILPEKLTEEMLLSNPVSWMPLLPQDLLQKLQKIFEDNTDVTELFDLKKDTQSAENLLANLIYLQNALDSVDSLNIKNETKSKDALLSVFQYVNYQLSLQENKVINIQENVDSQQFSKEIKIFLTTISSRLTVDSPASSNSYDRLAFLKSIYQQNFKLVEGLKEENTRDASQSLSLEGIESKAPLSRVQQFTLFIDQSGSKTVNQEQFIKEFQTILTRSSLQNMNGGMKLLIKLYPEHLGQLRIELLQQQGIVTARVVATTAGAKEMLDSQLQGLKNAFASQNIQVEKIEIVNSGLQQEEFDRSNKKDSNQQQFSNREEKEKDGKGLSFEESFQEEIMNLEV